MPAARSVECAWSWPVLAGRRPHPSAAEAAGAHGHRRHDDRPLSTDALGPELWSGPAPARLAGALALHERSGARVPERSGRRTERARVHAVHVMGGVTHLGPMRRPADDRLSGRRRLWHAHPRAWALRRHRRLRRFHAGQSGCGRRSGAGGDRRRTAVAQSANALRTKSREVEMRHGLPSPGHEPAKGSRRCSAVPVGDQTG